MEQKMHDQPEWLNDPSKVREVIGYLTNILRKLEGDDDSTHGDNTVFMEDRVEYHLKQLGIPQHLSGYKYLAWTLPQIVLKPGLLDVVTKGIYPLVANHFGSTPSRVERAIRHAIEVAWERALPEVLEEYFGSATSPMKGKATNSEFLATLTFLVLREVERR